MAQAGGRRSKGLMAIVMASIISLCLVVSPSWLPRQVREIEYEKMRSRGGHTSEISSISGQRVLISIGDLSFDTTPTPVPSPTAGGPSPSSPPDDLSGTKTDATGGGGGLSDGAKAGIAIGVIFGAVGAGGAFFIYWTRRQNMSRAYTPYRGSML